MPHLFTDWGTGAIRLRGAVNRDALRCMTLQRGLCVLRVCALLVFRASFLPRRHERRAEDPPLRAFVVDICRCRHPLVRVFGCGRRLPSRDRRPPCFWPYGTTALTVTSFNQTSSADPLLRHPVLVSVRIVQETRRERRDFFQRSDGRDCDGCAGRTTSAGRLRGCWLAKPIQMK